MLEEVFLSHRVQTEFGAQPISYPKGTRGSVLGDKGGRYVKVTFHIPLVPKVRETGAIPLKEGLRS